MRGRYYYSMPDTFVGAEVSTVPLWRRAWSVAAPVAAGLAVFGLVFVGLSRLEKAVR